MKRIILFVISTLIFTGLFAQLDRSVVPGPAAAPKINIGKPESFTLKNGLKVFVVENNKVPAVSYSLTLDIDPIVEGDAAGFVSLVGSLMRSGTKTKTKAEIDEAIDFIGASLNAYSSGMYARSLKKHSENLLEIMSDILLNPVFPQEELDKSVTQMKSALQVSKDSPDAIANNVRGMLLYGLDHPYGEIMTEKTLENINVEKLKTYHKTYFRPNVAYLVIVGDINVKEAKKQAEKYFGKWEKKDVPKHNYEYPQEYSAPKVAIANKDGATQSSIYVTHTVSLTPGHPDAIKTSVMNEILGGGSFNAKLFRNLREDKGFTYGSYSSLNTDKRVGRFTASADVRTSVTDSALHEILKEMHIMRNEMVIKEDLELTKNMMTGSFSRSLESPQTIANFALNIELYKLPADYYATYLEKLAAVTAQDVKEMANKYLKPYNSVILAVGDASAIREPMKIFSPTGEVTEYNYYAQEVVFTGIPAGVTVQTVIQANIDALGGEKALRSVKDMKSVSKMSMQGMEIELIQLQKAPDKVKVETKMMGNVMQAQIFNGTRGKVVMMGQEQILEGEQAEMMKEAAIMFPELSMLENTENLELVSMEEFEGNTVYKMNISKPDEMVTVVYFDIKTGLKLKEVTATPQGSVSVFYEEYKDFDGIKIPVKIKQSVGPQSFDIETIEVEINKGIDDSEFEI